MKRLVFSVSLLLAAADSGAVQIIHVPGDVTSLQTAINSISHGGIIEVAAGTYSAPSGGFVVSNLHKAFTIRAAAAATVVLDGANVNSVLRIMNTSPSLGGPVVFERITFYRGRSLSNGLAGGVTLSQADATFVDCVFQACWSDATQTGGGGIAVFTDSRAMFVRCQWLDNWATNEGGGLRVGGDATAWVHDSELYRNVTNHPNHRTTAAGGAIHVGDSDLVVTNTRLEDNEAGYVAGGLYAIGTWQDPVTEPHSKVVVANCTFVDNHAVADASVTPPGPTEAGAVHAEDQTTMGIFNSRFVENSAENGGGVNLYRAVVDVEGCVFQGNRATSEVAGRGLGGALEVLSNDTSADGSTNRRSGQLEVSDSLVQGRYGSVTTVGQLAGGIYVCGDKCRRYGICGFGPTAPASETRALVSLDGVAFADCDVLQAAPAGSWGGGMDVSLGDVTVTGGLFVGSDALGAGGSPYAGAGAAYVEVESEVEFTDVTFASNTALSQAGAFLAAGSATTVTSCDFVENNTTGASSYGRAMVAGPILNLYGLGLNLDSTGTVSSSTFSNNNGLPVFDADSHTGAINDVRYNSNTFYRSGNSLVYTDSIVGDRDVPGLNSLVVVRSGGRNTDKSQVDNVAAGSAPVVGAILAVPPTILPVVAAGDSASQTESFLAMAWSGGSATIDTAPLPGTWAVLSAGLGTHTLSVAGTPFVATITQGSAPAATFRANPAAIASGQSSTLSWSTTVGTFLDMTIDQGVSVTSAAAGSVVVSPTASTTYRLMVATKQGGVVKEVRVYVDEPGIFADGFNSGNTSAWSNAVP